MHVLVTSGRVDVYVRGVGMFVYEYVKDGVVGKMFGCVIMRGC